MPEEIDYRLPTKVKPKFLALMKRLIQWNEYTDCENRKQGVDDYINHIDYNFVTHFTPGDPREIDPGKPDPRYYNITGDLLLLTSPIGVQVKQSPPENWMKWPTITWSVAELKSGLAKVLIKLFLDKNQNIVGYIGINWPEFQSAVRRNLDGNATWQNGFWYMNTRTLFSHKFIRYVIWYDLDYIAAQKAEGIYLPTMKKTSTEKPEWPLSAHDDKPCFGKPCACLACNHDDHICVHGDPCFNCSGKDGERTTGFCISDDDE